MIYQGKITNEGLSKSIDIANNEGFELRPYKFAVSEFLGAFDASRDISSLEVTWYEGAISSFIKLDDSTVQFNCNIPAGESGVPRFTKEVYVIATDGVDDFLLCFAQPTAELTYDPEAELRIRIQFKINNIDVADLYNFNYTQATEINDHNADVNAHPDIQDALKDFGIYVNSPNAFNGQFIDRFPVLGPTVGNLNAVYWSTITNRYEPALSTNPIAKYAIGVYLASRDTVVYEGVIDYVNASPPNTKVYLSTLIAGQLTLSPSDTIIGYTLPNNKVFISIEVNEAIVEVTDPDGNKSVVLEPPLARTLILKDTNDQNWSVTISDDGILSTEETLDEEGPLFKITKPNLAFAEIRVDTDGNLYVQSPPLDNSILADDFYYIQSPNGTYWKFTVNLANEIVMSTYDNKYTIYADNGTELFEVAQTSTTQAVVGTSTYEIADLPDPLNIPTPTTKFAFANVGNDIVLPVYWDNGKWERFGSGMIGDYKYSLLAEPQFLQLHGSGWVRALGQDITGSKFHTLTGKTHLPDGRGSAIRGITDIAPIEFNPIDVDIASDSIFIPNHGYRTGMKIEFSSTGTVPTGIATRSLTTSNIENIYNRYFVIAVGPNTIKVATTFANAHAGVAVDITGQGTGVHTLHQRQDTGNRFNQQTGASDDSVGSWQDEGFRAHQHNAYRSDAGYGGGGADWPLVDPNSGNTSNTLDEGWILPGARSERETRMANISGYLYIKIN